MHRDPRKLDELRQGRNEIENHVIDEFVSGYISRREFFRRGSIIGLSIPVLGAIASACGGANSSPSSAASSSSGTARPGATLKIASQVPTGAIDPLSIADEGGLTMLQQSAENLVFNNPHTNVLEPVLATKWTSNAAGDVWTFTYAGKTVRGKDSKGLRDLAMLLASRARYACHHSRCREREQIRVPMQHSLRHCRHDSNPADFDILFARPQQHTQKFAATPP